MKYDGQVPSTDLSRPGFSDDIAAEMVANSTAVFVTGRSRSAQGGTDFATVAYNATTGAQLWATRKDVSAFDVPYGIAVSPDGSKVFVTGEVEVDNKSREMYTVAYNATTGAQLWEKTDAGGTKIDRGRDVQVSPDGSLVIVTGDRQSPIGSTADNWDYVTIAYQASSGVVAWQEVFNGEANSFDLTGALSVDSERAYVTGRSHGGTTNFDYGTVAYDLTTGDQEWVASYGTTTWDEPFDIVVNPDGSEVYVTGETDTDIATVAYNTEDGGEVWDDVYASPDPNSFSSARGRGKGITTNPAGTRIYVVGDSYVTNGLDITTLAYTKAGVRSASAVLSGPNGNDFARDIIASGSGTNERVFITGERQNAAGDRDITLAAYTGSLAEKWVRDRGGDRNDQAVSVALDSRTSPTSVFSSGSDDAPVTNFDYDTAAYDATVVTASPSPTATASPTPSPTPTATASPTPTGSASPSPTPSRSPSPTPTATASATPSATPTATASPTPTATASPTVSATPTPTPTATASLSPSPSPSSSPTPGPTTADCEDGIDNDGDGRIDFPDDDGCTSTTDDNEASPTFATSCRDVEPGQTFEGPDGLIIGGTPGDDDLVGSDGDDLICGFGGDDTIDGLGGNDTIGGGSGRDAISGGDGDDSMRAGAGADEVRGNAGRDRAWGGRGRDDIRGATGHDDLRGSRGKDSLRGGRGHDSLDGGPGRDRCRGGSGNNDLTSC